MCRAAGSGRGDDVQVTACDAAFESRRPMIAGMMAAMGEDDARNEAGA